MWVSMWREPHGGVLFSTCQGYPSRMMVKSEAVHVVHEDPQRRCAKDQDNCKTLPSIATEEVPDRDELMRWMVFRVWKLGSTLGDVIVWATPAQRVRVGVGLVHRNMVSIVLDLSSTTAMQPCGWVIVER
jgi:hypothetical protein